MNILFIGDIVGAPGRRVITELLPRAVDHYCIDLVVANGENASGGLGITPQVADQFSEPGSGSPHQRQPYLETQGDPPLPE